VRALRVVGILEVDGEITVVLEDPERRERFTLPADEKLRAAARGDLSGLGQIANQVGSQVGSQLRPREIQARIRAGASVAELAQAAGVSEQKVERFAYPVLLERSRTAELARLAHPARVDGPDSRTLTEVVADTFGLRGLEYDEAVWDSWKGEDGRWIVALSWTAGRSDNRAHWTFQPGAGGGIVTVVDENAGDLVKGLPARPLRPIGPVIDLARDEAAAAAEQPRRADVARAGNQRIEHRRPEQPRHEPSSAEQHPEQPASEPSRPDEQRRGVAASPAHPTGPPPAVEPAAAAEPSPAAARRGQKGRPVMPSWDEVLLGVKGRR